MSSATRPTNRSRGKGNDTERLRELAAELGFWPATTDEADIEHHRQHKKNKDYWLARGHRFDHLRREHERRRQRQNPEAG